MLLKDYKVKIPEGSRIQKKDNYYYVYKPIEYIYKKDKKQSIESRVCIGRKLDDEYMIPNTAYTKFYDDVNKQLNDPPKFSDTLKIGNMLLINKILKKISLDKILDVHEDKKDMIINLMSYLIIEGNSSFQHYPSFAYNHNIIGDIYSDSYICEFLKKFTDKEKEVFLSAWNKLYTKQDKIYINYDSTNMNSASTGIELAEYGHAKKDENLPQINISYASSAKDSTPLYYDIYPGSIIDNTELKSSVNKITSYGYKNIGFILDRGYYSKTNIDYLRDNEYSFILMIKDNNTFLKAFKMEMKDKIKLDYSSFIEAYQVYGSTIKAKLFKNDKKSSYIHLYYDELKASSERANLLTNIKRIEEDINSRLNSKDIKDRHKSKCDKYSKLFNLHYIDEYLVSYSPKRKEIGQLVNNCGYFCLVTSESLTAYEAIDIYRDRDSIEKLFMMLKSEMDMEKFKVQSDASLRAKFHIAFIASIVRNEIYKVSKQLKATSKDKKSYTVPSIIKELEKIECTKNINDLYQRRYALTAKQKKILEQFNIKESDIQKEVEKINRNNNNNGHH